MFFLDLFLQMTNFIDFTQIFYKWPFRKILCVFFYFVTLRNYSGKCNDDGVDLIATTFSQKMAEEKFFRKEEETPS